MKLRNNGLIKITALLIVATIAILGGAVAVYSAKAENVAPVSKQAPVAAPRPVVHPEAGELFTLVNEERVKAGLAPLVIDERLNASAAAKCADMQTYNYKAHVSPSGVRWTEFVKPQFGEYYGHMSENLSWNYATSAAAVNGWMNSPSHRGAILDASYTHVGYAVCGIRSDNITIYNNVVQHFRG